MKKTRSKKSRDTVPLRCYQFDIVRFIKFAAGVVDTSGNFPPVTSTLLENLPQVSKTPAVLVTKFAAGVVDTCRKFANGVVDTGGTPSHSKYICDFMKFHMPVCKIHNPNNILYRVYQPPLPPPTV
jgi:hypothetical protein